MFKTNEYFGGKVASIAFQTNTVPATVGVMAAGEYTFNTNAREVMQVISGALTINRLEACEWQTFEAGQSFEVPANSAFKVKADVQTAYLCTYHEDA